MKRKSQLAILIAALLPASVLAQSIVGTVLNTKGSAVSNAVVELEGSDIKVTTDENGRFVIAELNNGLKELHIVAPGYAHLHRDVSVNADENQTVSFTLERSPIEVIDIEATPIHMSAMESASPVSVLSGAAQNHDYVVFGCGDGVLIAHQQDDVYEAQKVANIEAVGTERIGTLYGHENSDTIFGIAAGHDGSGSVLLSIHPENAEMEEVELQLADGASAVSYSFSASGEHFLVLDSLGFLNVLTGHDHDGEMHWELAGQVDITEQDVSTMPEGMSFSMTVAQNGEFAYIADPIAQHIVQVHLEDLEVEGELELTFPPASLTWLGIAEVEDGHDH